jgi:hypothetical protein
VQLGESRKTKVLSFESWVTKADWFKYALSNRDKVPHLLCDRSPCQDPFFDLFAPSVSGRRPMITGLCRCLKHFEKGGRYIYVTRFCTPAAKHFGLDTGDGRRYLGVASMIVERDAESHEGAAREFQPRRYVVSPFRTPYPPGLAHDEEPVAAAYRESCIVHRDSKSCSSSKRQVALTPDESTPQDWHNEYSAYHKRQFQCALRAAFCKFELIVGREALAIKIEEAPVLSPEHWEGKQLNVNGVLVEDETGEAVAGRIAKSGFPMRTETP